MRSAVIGALIGLTLLLVPSAASAVSDAGCAGPSDATPFTPLGDRREAQTFVPVHTGALDRVALAINNISTADPDFLVQILDTDASDFPTNNALASATIPKASVPVGPVTVEASFSPPAVVTAGHVYAVTISRPGANFLIPTWMLATRAAGSCTGHSFYSYGATLGWQTEPSDADVIYQTFVEPAALTPTGVGNAGFQLVNKHGRLYARVPGPGKLIVDDAKKPKHHKKKSAGMVKRTKTRAKKAGDVLLPIQLTNKAIFRALKRQKLNLLAKVTYRPTNGTPSSLTFRIKLKL